MGLAWRPLLREVWSYLLVGLFAGLLLVLVWWTRHPESESLSAVRQWPVVGTLAGRLQDHYRPAPTVLGAGDDASVAHSAASAAAAVASPVENGNPERLVVFDVIYQPRPPRPYVWVSAGARLRCEPSFEAESLLEIEAMTNLFVEERRGDWVRVRHRGVDAWVVKPRAGSSHDHGSRPSPVLPLVPVPPEAAIVDRALAAMGGEGRRFRLGPYPGWSDFDAGEVIEVCEEPIARLEDLYRRQLGVEPLGESVEMLLLFDSIESYETFAERPVPQGMGHAGPGYAATHAGGRSAAGVCATLVHEAAHLLNRRSIGPALPPWLGEGIAEWAQWSVTSESPPSYKEWTSRGGELPSLASLVDLDEAAFWNAGRGAEMYAASGYWVTYLLADPEHAAGYREFLRYLARGGPWAAVGAVDGVVEAAADMVPEAARLTPGLGDDLLHYLGRDYDRLDAAIRTWLWSRR